MRKRKNKFIALLLSAVMMATLLPMTALADVDLGGGDQQVVAVSGGDLGGDGSVSGNDNGSVSGNDNGSSSGGFSVDVDYHGGGDWWVFFPVTAVGGTAPTDEEVVTITNTGDVDVALTRIAGHPLSGDPNAFVVSVGGLPFVEGEYIDESYTDDEGNLIEAESFHYMYGELVDGPIWDVQKFHIIIKPGESIELKVKVNPDLDMSESEHHQSVIVFEYGDADAIMNFDPENGDWYGFGDLFSMVVRHANFGVGASTEKIILDGPNMVVKDGDPIRIYIKWEPADVVIPHYWPSVIGGTGEVKGPPSPWDPNSTSLWAETDESGNVFFDIYGVKTGKVTIEVTNPVDGASIEYDILVVGTPDAPADDDNIPEDKVEELLQNIVAAAEGEGKIETNFETLGGNTLTPEILEALRDEGVALEIIIDSGIGSGIKLVIDPETIDEGELSKPVNLELGFAFITEGVEVPLNDGKSFELADNSFLIIPPTSGDFGFELQIVIPNEILEEWGLDVNSEDLKLYYISKDGNVVELEYGVDWEIDGTDVIIKISGASSYVLTNSEIIIHVPSTPGNGSKPNGSKPGTPSVTQKQPSGTVTAPATKPAVVKPQPLMYRVIATSLNERTGPGANFPRVGVLPRGTLLEIKQFSPCGQWALAHTGTWVAVRFLEYVSGTLQTPDALTGLTDYVVRINRGSRLNVRAAAGVSGAVVGTLRAGDVVKVVKIENGWAQIAYTSQVPVAYVSAQFLRAR